MESDDCVELVTGVASGIIETSPARRAIFGVGVGKPRFIEEEGVMVIVIVIVIVGVSQFGPELGTGGISDESGPELGTGIFDEPDPLPLLGFPLLSSGFPVFGFPVPGPLLGGPLPIP